MNSRQYKTHILDVITNLSVQLEICEKTGKSRKAKWLREQMAINKNRLKEICKNP